MTSHWYAALRRGHWAILALTKQSARWTGAGRLNPLKMCGAKSVLACVRTISRRSWPHSVGVANGRAAKSGAVVCYERHESVVGGAQRLSRAAQETQVFGYEDAADADPSDGESGQDQADACGVTTSTARSANTNAKRRTTHLLFS